MAQGRDSGEARRLSGLRSYEEHQVSGAHSSEYHEEEKRELHAGRALVMYMEVPFAHSGHSVHERNLSKSGGKKTQTGSGVSTPNAPGQRTTLATIQREIPRKPHDCYKLGRALMTDLVSGVHID